MCDPITLAGIGLSIGSAAANGMAASKAAKARDDVLAAERIRQRQYNAEAQGVTDHSQNLYKDFGGQQAAKAADLSAYFGANSDPGAANATAASAMPSSASSVTTQEQAGQKSLADAFIGQQAGALGDLRSFGEMMGQTSRDQARDASLVGQIGGFMKGSSSVVPYELDHASHAGDSLKLFGDVLGGLGSVATMYGLKTPTAAVSAFGGAPSSSVASLAAGRAADLASIPGYTAARGMRPLSTFF